MKMNRRNVLIGIGTVAAGSGAVLGSGALTTVEADRTLNVDTADDDSAYLQLSPDATSFVSTSGTGNNGQAILEIDLSTLNDDATTTIDPAFTATNGLSDGVGLRIRSDAFSSGSEPTGLTIQTEANDQDLASFPTAPGDDHNLDPNGGANDSVSVSIVIDTNDLDVSTVNTITIEADTSAYNT